MANGFPPNKRAHLEHSKTNPSRTNSQNLEDKDGFVIPTVIPKPFKYTPLSPKNIPIKLENNNTVSGVMNTAENPKSSNFFDEDLVDRSFHVNPIAATLLPTQINALAYSDDMRWVLLGADDAYIRKYDFFASMNGKISLTMAHRHATVDVCSRSAVILSYWDNEIYQNKSPGSSQIISNNFEEQFSPVFSLYMHSRALWCLSGLNNGDVNLYTVRHSEGRCHHALRGHRGPVSAIKAFNNETYAATGAWDKKVMIWDLNTGSCIRELTKHKNQICSISSQPGNSDQMLLTTSYDGRSFLWDLREATKEDTRPAIEIASPQDCPPWSTSSCWDREGNIVFTGRRNCTVDGIEVRMNQVSRVLKLPPSSGPVSQVLSHPTRNFLLCGSYDNLRMWNLDLNQDDSSAAPSGTNTENSGYLSPFQLIPGHQTGTLSQMGEFLVFKWFDF